ncbi:hypothetical protein KIPB_001894 [Kipferlia bialata]|uniref:Uncharacterized protein n=1 Tax=Kipferlia bialata TaxID=797122 RepID=A0A9K3CQM1_9EUKA|nr:hypothetical protein KIPB_001894 [Kipferlia bialata]|eukprot:g1894.t1
MSFLALVTSYICIGVVIKLCSVADGCTPLHITAAKAIMNRDRDSRYAFNLAFWDYIGRIASESGRSISNTAILLAHLLGPGNKGSGISWGVVKKALGLGGKAQVWFDIVLLTLSTDVTCNGVDRGAWVQLLQPIKAVGHEQLMREYAEMTGHGNVPLVTRMASVLQSLVKRLRRRDRQALLCLTIAGTDRDRAMARLTEVREECLRLGRKEE